MPEPEGGEQKYMILGLGLINCKNQKSWLVMLKGGCHEPTVLPFCRTTRTYQDLLLNHYMAFLHL